MKKRHLTTEQKFWLKCQLIQKHAFWVALHPQSPAGIRARRRKNQAKLKAWLNQIYQGTPLSGSTK